MSAAGARRSVDFGSAWVAGVVEEGEAVVVVVVAVEAVAVAEEAAPGAANPARS
jgi:hypothetical protein